MKTKLIPFTIEAWKAGGKPVTADGREVKRLTHYEEASGISYPVIGVRDSILDSWDISGNCIYRPGEKTNLMLEVEDTEKQLYLVVISTPVANGYGMAYNVYVSDDIEYSKEKDNYLTHLKLPPCNS
jgi:hypothetical protein